MKAGDVLSNHTGSHVGLPNYIENLAEFFKVNENRGKMKTGGIKSCV